ncbi:hypothetical protein TNIN_194071 [Trichonephila inaurata madagascariensis]|uniref:Uncharacterized protein n=1 Tax=Trichonephila inaurata madagascariensis TaxID=2747483 RepID=A0A8X6ICX9_9ARAC|nr:hypothetical protein TNIN_194071 [Trichonephila inaurata madagascariensis]
MVKIVEVYLTYADIENLIDETENKLAKIRKKGTFAQRFFLYQFVDKLYAERYERYQSWKHCRILRKERKEANQSLIEDDCSLGLDTLFDNLQNDHASSHSSMEH